jgi:hypothetical protein
MLGLKLRASGFLSRCSNTSATSPAIYVSFYSLIVSLNRFVYVINFMGLELFTTSVDGPLTVHVISTDLTFVTGVSNTCVVFPFSYSVWLRFLSCNDLFKEPGLLFLHFIYWFVTCNFIDTLYIVFCNSYIHLLMWTLPGFSFPDILSLFLLSPSLLFFGDAGHLTHTWVH